MLASLHHKEMHAADDELGLDWHSIASSSDGTHLAAVVYDGDIWTGH
jgi:hypothetical protein